MNKFHYSPEAMDQTSNGSEGVEIELEPTIAFEAGASSATPDQPSIHMALLQGSAPSLTQENLSLLRSRLRSAALFMGVVYSLFFLLGLLELGTISALADLCLGLRAAVCLGVFALLASRVSLNQSRLKIIELGLFGSLIAFMVVSQYFNGSELIRQGDLPRLIAMEMGGVINFLVLMVLYGVLIPNDPRFTARVVLTMALGPLLVFVILQEKTASTPLMSAHLTSGQTTVTNLLLILCAAALAIYASFTLQSLRRDLREARRLGQYQLGEKIGEGGMGEVYLAEHQLLKRPCALKLIKADADSNALALARFEREVRTAALLTHPNTIAIFDYGHTDDGTFYYVMEYLPGMTLGALVARFGPLPPGRAVYLIRQVCGALGEAHRLGLVHRDLKPANVFVAILGGKCDVAKVLDYGLVKVNDPDAPQLTADYTVSGTPLFMAPEQARADRELDGRSDLYSLGGILYYVLTGRPPFEGKTPVELMIAHARDPVVPPSQIQRGIPADLEAVVLRCLAKAPEDRYADARSLLLALEECGCAHDWNEARAEEWWIAQATAEAPGEPAATA